MMSKNWLLIPAIMAAGLFTLKPATAQTCSPPPSGMVGWWPGDGNANDIIGGNNGTFIGSTGSVTFVPGEVLQALSFNGTGFVQVQPPKRDPTNIKGDLTIEAWINPATAIRGDIVVHGSGDDHVGAYTFRYGDGNDQKLLVSVSDGGTAESDYETSSSAIQNPGTWNHVAVTIQGTTATIYVNGSAVPGYYSTCTSDSCAPATQLTANRFSDNGVLSFGGRFDADSDLPYTGLLDEVSIYNRALLATDIAAIYNAGPGGKCKCTLQPLSPPYPGYYCGYDVSYDNPPGSRSLSPGFWKTRMGNGQNLAIVEGLGSCDLNTHMPGDPNPYAQRQLYLARTSGQMRTAGYCYLNYANPALTGGQQIDTCLSLMGSEASQLAFVGVDVEFTDPKTCDNRGASQEIQRMIVSQAITEVLNKHQVPVLYTSRGEFENVVGATRGFCQMGASLWDASPDGLRDLANDYKAGQVVPFKPYGGWSSRVGKQFWFHLVPPSSVEGDSDIFNATWLESPTAPVCQ